MGYRAPTGICFNVKIFLKFQLIPISNYLNLETLMEETGRCFRG